ncbi:MAG: helix-turn-helix domain-containing protein, partial [Acidimicrobiaceae bacterium]|nr:helix-turn-helix domain-containing protein [Acidimicrobiaceae bacterium]
PLRLLEEPEELSFGEQLRLARQHAGLTVDALARLCHVNPATIWRWENNKVDPQRRLRKRLIAVLDVQYDHPSRAG